MAYLVDYTVYSRVLTGLEGYDEAFKFVNENVGEIYSLKTIHIDTVEHSYHLLSEAGVDLGEVFMRLSNVVRSLIDSTVSGLIEPYEYVEEAMHLSIELGVEPRLAIYNLVAREMGYTHVSMDGRLDGVEGVTILRGR